MKNINKLLAFVLSAVLVLGIFSAGPACAFAAEARSAGAKITVDQVFSYKNGNKPTAGDTFNYRLTPKNSGNPMPTGSKGGVFDFSLSGSSSRDIDLSFDHAGIYEYKLEHILSKKINGYTYDMSAYEIEVYVANDGQGGLEVAVVVIDSSGKKPGDITYRHSYSTGGGTPKTGDGGELLLWSAVCAGSMLLSLSAHAFYRGRKQDVD